MTNPAIIHTIDSQFEADWWEEGEFGVYAGDEEETVFIPWPRVKHVDILGIPLDCESRIHNNFEPELDDEESPEADW